MSAWSAILDPTQENASNTPVELVGTSSTANIFLLDLKMPPPDSDAIAADSPDTEGSVIGHKKLRNRKITATVRVTGATASAFYAALASIQEWCGRVHRENDGAFRVTAPGDSAVTFDVKDAQADVDLGISTQMRRADVVITMDALPLGRGDEVVSATTHETTLPVARITLASIAGDAPALGRLIVTDAQAKNQRSMHWGLREYDSATTAALFYQAEALTPESGAAIATRSGASGGGSNNVISHTALATEWTSILSTQMLAASHLSHVGQFRVRARVYSPTSDTTEHISLKLAWSEGDFTFWNENDEVMPGVPGAFSVIDLGLITLRKVASGTQQWQGRVLAKTDDTALTYNDIEVDAIWLEPVTEGSGELLVDAPAGDALLLGSDIFGLISGAMNGDTATGGGTWATSGGATDFTAGTLSVTRSVNTDAAPIYTGARFAILGATSYTNMAVSIDVTTDVLATTPYHFAIARWTDVNNYFGAYLNYLGASGWRLGVFKRVTGTTTVLMVVTVPLSTAVALTNEGLKLTAFSDGTWMAEVGGVVYATDQDSALATGGALASGKPGFADYNSGGTIARTYKNFTLHSVSLDMAIPASQSLEVRSDRVQREDAGGTIWVPRPDYIGDYLRIPPAGPRNRTSEILVKASRGLMGISSDPAIDDLDVAVGVTPRYRVVPEP